MGAAKRDGVNGTAVIAIDASLPQTVAYHPSLADRHVGR
jgi:hypothetical protein